MDKIGWMCPNCGAVLGRPPFTPGGPFGRVTGVVRCIGCNNAVSAADVYNGKYDVDRKPVKSPVREKRSQGIGLFKTVPNYLKKLFGRDFRGWEQKWGRKLKCWECYWYADAQLDGVKNKGICNFGTGQERPFTMVPGDAVIIAWGNKRACDYFHPLGIGPPKKRKSKAKKQGRSAQKVEKQIEQPQLMQAFRNTDAPVQERIAEVLEKIGKPAVELLCKALFQYFPDSDRGNAIVAETLGMIGDERAIEPLIDALCRGEVEEAEDEIEEALAKIGKPAIEPLIQALRQQDIYCRWGLAKALGNIGDGRAVEPLIQVLNEKDWDYRELVLKEVAIAIGKLEDERAIKPLRELSKDKDKDIRNAAKKALDNIKVKKD